MKIYHFVVLWNILKAIVLCWQVVAHQKKENKKDQKTI